MKNCLLKKLKLIFVINMSKLIFVINMSKLIFVINMRRIIVHFRGSSVKNPFKKGLKICFVIYLNKNSFPYQ